MNGAVEPGYCLIAIESIPDAENHYRLGVQFLKNFYVSLDYEDNIIMIALNNHGLNNGAHAVVDPDAKKKKEPPKTPNYETLVFFVILILSCMLGGIGCQKYQSFKKAKRGGGLGAGKVLFDADKEDHSTF